MVHLVRCVALGWLVLAVSLHGEDFEDERVLSLVESFESKKSETVFEHEVLVENLNEQLEKALTREEESAADAGNLDLIALIREEKKRIRNGGPPEQDEAGLPESLKRLRTVWRTRKTELDQKRDATLATYEKSFLAELEKIEVVLTKERKIDEAFQVREFRTGFKGTGSAPSGGSSVDRGGWVDLFNGRDLSVWKVQGNSKSYSVRDGVLTERVVDGPALLIYEGSGGQGAVFRDFEFEAELKGAKGANSGFFFQLESPGKNGIEVNIANGDNLKNQTGSLWDLQNVKNEIKGQENWFVVTVTVKGDQVTVKKDGRTINTWQDSKGKLSEKGGKIAIQANSRQPSGFEFRRVRIRRL